MEGSPFVPASLLNQLRRSAVEQLMELQAREPEVEIHDPEIVIAGLRASAISAGVEKRLDAAGTSARATLLHLLVRTPEQLDAAIPLRPASITLDYLDLYGLRPSIDKVKAAGIEARVASPRVLKPGEERIADFLLRCDCPILVRPVGLLESLRGRTTQRLDGDFSLNAANAVTSRMLFEQGISRLTPTHDLNAAQIAQLALTVDPEGDRRIEAILYQHLPVFHTEHCVFCRFLSTGTSYKDCGRPCESHIVALRDDSGRAHPVMADVGCRNTVFGAEAQEASRHLDDWRTAGIAHFRLEFAHESGEQTAEIAEAFAKALAGRLPSQELSRQLRNLTPQGVTEGSLYVPAGYKEFPILQ
jgi:putative protease